jgi:hypothetical protein
MTIQTIESFDLQNEPYSEDKKAFPFNVDFKRRGKLLNWGFIAVPGYDPLVKLETGIVIINIRTYLGLYPHDGFTTIFLTNGKEAYTTLNKDETWDLVLECLNQPL